MANKTLEQTIKDFKEGFGLLYGTRDFHIVRVSEGEAETKAEHKLVTEKELSQFYFARFFDGTKEVRWKNGVEATVAIPKENTLANQYLLWGEVKGEKNGWTNTVEERAAELWIPCKWDLGTNDVIVETREILAQDEYGNWFVQDEVLVGFKTVGRPTK